MPKLPQGVGEASQEQRHILVPMPRLPDKSIQGDPETQGLPRLFRQGHRAVR